MSGTREDWSATPIKGADQGSGRVLPRQLPPRTAVAGIAGQVLEKLPFTGECLHPQKLTVPGGFYGYTVVLLQ